MQVNNNNLAARYSLLKGQRAPYLDRARKASRLTIPSLMPQEGAGAGGDYPVGFQSLGARLINHLTSKITLALLPPNRPFHRTDIDEISIAQMAEEPGQKAAIQDSLAKYDRALNTHIEASQLRTKANEAIKQLIVSGTVVMHIKDEQDVRIHKLDSFVQTLDSTGTLLELIIEESVSPLTLSPEIVTECKVIIDDEGSPNKHDEVAIYTGIKISGDKYKVWQEINDIIVPGSEGSYPKDVLPFLSMRFYAVDGESYGRAYVEEYIGDLVSLEGQTKAVHEGSILSNRIIFFLNNGGMTSPSHLEKARNGAVLRGNANEISTLQVNKQGDMQVGLSLIQNIESRLSYAFLLHSAIQRSGERVTAEEIRILARELEEGLGGVYSLLSHEFQLRIVKVYRGLLEKTQKLPSLPKDIVSVKIVTGLEALGRGQDVDQLQMFLQDVSTFGGAAMQLLDLREILVRLAVSRGIDTTDLVKSVEQLQMEREQAMMEQIAQGAGPGIAGEAASHMMQNPEEQPF